MNCDSLGDYETALAHHREALAIARRIGAADVEMNALCNLGAVHSHRGDPARALGFYEAALALARKGGNRDLEARTLGNLGVLYQELGDSPRGRRCQEETLRIAREGGYAELEGNTLHNLALLRRDQDDYEAARRLLEEALRVHESIGRKAMAARARSELGRLHTLAGDDEKAYPALKAAIDELRSLHDEVGALHATTWLAAVCERLGRTDEALAVVVDGFARAREIDDPALTILCLEALARLHRRRGAHVEAAAAARGAVASMEQTGRGLSEEHGAAARSAFASVFENGALAAVALRDAGEVFFFLESGRAWLLLKALGGEQALRATIPQPLRDAEDTARAAQSIARGRYDQAAAGGDRALIAQRRAELQSAHDRLSDAVARTRREAADASDLVHPRAASLEAVRAVLRPEEALVLYGIFDEGAVALVVSRDGARLVDLGAGADIRTLAAAGQRDWDAPRVAALRGRLVEPLALPARITRLLVSPDGATGYVPFGLLAADREIAYVPSGTAYVRLSRERDRRGEGVLALAWSDATRHLPDAEASARAVGYTVLVGPAATRAALSEALGRRPRWRAVHFACHSLVDAERPTLSALLLAPEREDDGRLTSLDLCRVNVPADLVVLSACETARGKVYRAEGIVGLARAFMTAGAPRVLCSLWKVDDAATRELMGKFYELWRKGLAPTAALRGAQEHVRSREQWRDPQFWAAWVLWGLPD